jgi:hypothetical protein
MSYIIETRTPETEERRAGEWHSDGMGTTEPIVVATEAEAAVAIQNLRQVGPDWAAAEYRARELSPREMVALVRAKGGVFLELAGHMDALLDESDQRERGAR